ncbi:MAG: MFS transporter [Acidimicrobiales bacterium]
MTQTAPNAGSFRSVALAFVSNSLMWGSVVPRIPDLADRLDASPAELAVPLFAFMFGGLISSSGSAALLRRHMPAWGQVVGVALGASGIALGAFGTSLWVVAPLFLVGGLGDGLQDVAMNAAGVDLEDHRGRPMLSSLHGLWSVGFLTASVVGAAMAALEVSVPVHIAAACAIAGATGVIAARGFVTMPPHPPAASSDRTGALSRFLVLVGAATGVGAVMEMVTNDWSALYLRDRLGASAGIAALAPAVFMAGMVVGRAFGDRMVRRVGATRMLALSAVVVAVALVVGLAPSAPAPALAGIGVAGLGSAFTFPGLFSLAARAPGVTREQGLAVVSTIGRLGFVVGPILAGVVAEATSLRATMYVPVVAACVVAAMSVGLRRAQVVGAAGAG